MNRFFSLEAEGGETPRRVYALFDQRSDERIYLDAVNADWFENSLEGDSGFSQWMKVSDWAPLHVIELHDYFSDALRLSQAARSDDHAKAGDGIDDDADQPLWFRIELDPAGGDESIYHGLFAEARPVGIVDISPASKWVSDELDKAFELASYVATRRQIEDALAVADPLEWVGVYDVGQGSANGICDGEAFPLVYFDLGGGVLANKRTFPTQFHNICTTQRPKVVLSHWDWDHWSSAARFPDSQRLTWIVPEQKLGAVHATMAGEIARQGRLLVWPDYLSRVQVGQIRIEKCTGKSGRNNTGLAMFVDGPNGELPIMLTGDARYSAIPSGFADVLSIVAAHHGADMKSNPTPSCTGDPAARVAYSYGQGITFTHPRQCTYDRHHQHGWSHSDTDPTGAIDRHTPELRPRLGNIALSWSAKPIPPQQCGGGRCSLQLEQS